MTDVLKEYDIFAANYCNDSLVQAMVAEIKRLQTELAQYNEILQEWKDLARQRATEIEALRAQNSKSSKSLLDYIGRKLQVKITKGKPNPKNAPKWATALGQTPYGAWHWLEKDGPLETSDSDRYFPLSGKTEFTGFVSEYEDERLMVDPLDTHRIGGA